MSFKKQYYNKHNKFIEYNKEHSLQEKYGFYISKHLKELLLLEPVSLKVFRMGLEEVVEIYLL
jgi:hypothetical protein